MPGVGNDVVDLGEPENQGKSGDGRFLARVFTDQEQEMIALAARPDTLLWSLWAAKEAAYKAISGGSPDLSSVPRRYPVHLAACPTRESHEPFARRGFFAPASPQNSRCVLPGSDLQESCSNSGAEAACFLTGRVTTPRGEVAVRITLADDYVHALAREQGDDFTGIVYRVDRMDRQGDSGDASAFVRRQLVAEVSRRLGHPCTELAVRTDPPGSGVPRLFRGDRRLPVDISLSHDGRFAAFAFLIH